MRLLLTGKAREALTPEPTASAATVASLPHSRPRRRCLDPSAGRILLIWRGSTGEAGPSVIHLAQGDSSSGQGKACFLPAGNLGASPGPADACESLSLS